MDTGPGVGHGHPWDGDVAKREGASWDMEGRGPGILEPGPARPPPPRHAVPDALRFFLTCYMFVNLACIM